MHQAPDFYERAGPMAMEASLQLDTAAAWKGRGADHYDAGGWSRLAGKTMLNKVLPAGVCIPVTPAPGHGRHAGFRCWTKVTAAGTPSARSLRCSPAGSRSSWTATLISPPGCLTTVQAVSSKPGRWLAG